jgi:hypothetical protein
MRLKRINRELARRNSRRQLQLEPLEGRALMTAYSFTKIAESSPSGYYSVGASSMNNAGLAAYEGFRQTNEIGHPIYADLYAGNGIDPPTLITSYNYTATGGNFAVETDINDLGQVAFRDATGYYRGSGGPLDAMNAPTLSPGYVFLNNAGVTAFFDGGGSQGMYVWDGTKTTEVVPSSRDLVFGLPGFGGQGPPSINDSGTIVFRALVRVAPDTVPALLPADFRYAIVEADAATGDLHTIVGPSSTAAGYAYPIINNAGDVTLVDPYKLCFVDGQEIQEYAIEILHNGSPHMVVNTTTTQFSSFFSGIALNDSGQIAFMAYLDGGTMPALFTGPDPVADRLIGQGDSFDGSIVQSLGFDSRGFNNNGQVLFDVTLTDGRYEVVRADISRAASVSDSAAITEGNTGTRNAVFTVSLDGPSTQTITIPYSTADGTATSPADYTAQSGTLTFSPGETVKSVAIAVKADTLDEDDESFSLVLGSPTNAVIADGSGDATILDDDPSPTLSIADAATTEGNTGAKLLSFRVTLSKPSGREVSVNYTTAVDTGAANPATPDIDFVSTIGTLVIPAGASSGSIAVPLIPDLTTEADESFRISLSSAVNTSITDGEALGTITNDDPIVTLRIADAKTTEGNTGTKQIQFAVTTSRVADHDVAVDFTTAPALDGSLATEGIDYVPASGTLVIPAGARTGYINVTLNADLTTEPDELFQVLLTNSVHSIIVDDTALGTIINDDPTLTLKIADAKATEGNTGTKQMTFTVTMSRIADQDVAVDFTTAPALDGNLATEGIDYIPASGKLVIPAGARTGTMSVTLNADLTTEPDELFQVLMANPVNVTILDDTALGTIINDDPTVTLKIADARTTEGNTGTKQIQFTVTTSRVTDQDVAVDFITAPAVGGDLATEGIDYLPASGTLVIPAGARTGSVSVTLNADLTTEPDELFRVLLANPVNSTIVDDAALGTIANDDPIVTLKIADAKATEGNTGTKQIQFTVTTSRIADQDVAVDFTTGPALEGNLATEGIDYIPASGTLVIPAGARTGTVYVTLNADLTTEPDELFQVLLSNPLNGTIVDDRALGTIINDDPIVTLKIADAIAIEGNSGTTVLRFMVTLSRATDHDLQVDFATAPSTDPAAASAGVDYEATSGALVIAAGATFGYIDVTIYGDTQAEANELFTVLLSNPVDSLIVDGVALGTIKNDDV